jgi:hypothetical protein
MASDLLGDYWRQAGEALGFIVEAPYVVRLPEGQCIEFSCHLPEFGAPRGMLLSHSYAEFSAHAKALAASGYGYSVLSFPGETVDLASVIEVLQDWGWTASKPAPGWLGGEA